jgi:hypothetical protein
LPGACPIRCPLARTWHRNVAGKIQSVVVLVAVRVPEANESTAT